MIKRYLYGFLIITLLLCQPMHIIAVEGADTNPRPENETTDNTTETSDNDTVETVHEPSPDETNDETTDESTDPPVDEPVNEPPPTDPPTDEPPTDETTDEPTEPPADEPTNPPTDEPPIEDGEPVEPIDETEETPDDDTEGEDGNPRPEDETDDETTDEPTDPPIEPANEPDDTPPHLTINELMIGSEVNPEKDSWIEFYNPTDGSINLDDWQIRGVTAGGRWINIVSEPQAIEPDGYFLFSYYSNSSYSALAVKPEMTKSSIFFEAGPIEIEIRDPSEQIIDKAVMEHEISDEFRSYERVYPIADGDADESWERSDKQINLKENLLNTFATPGNKNSCHPEFEDDTVETDRNPSPDDETDDETTEPPPPSPPSTSSPATQPIIYPAYQLINEFMVNPEGNDTEGEWIELYNNTNSPIDISNWYLDDAEGNSSPYKINYLVLMPNEYRTINAPALNLSLKNSDDEVRLLDPNKEVKEIIRYFGAEEGLSYAKKENGNFDWTPLATPGTSNQFPAPPKVYRIDDVVFKSVLPNPDGKDGGNEAITFKNNLSEIVEMTGWTLVNQKNKTYELMDVLNPYQKQTINPADIGLSLVNKADQLSLIDPAGNLIDRINWMDAPSDQIIFKPNYFQDGMRAKVTKVIDGDTIVVEIDDELFKVRLIGVDTPETVHPFQPVEEFGKQASDYVKGLLNNQTITLDFDENKMDKYNRLLAYIYLGDVFINADLIQNGYGYAYTRFPFKYLNEFIQYEQYARENGLGLWANEDMHHLTEGEIGKSRLEDELNLENTVELVIDENIENNEENTDTSLKLEVTCPTDGLKIDAILPSPQKGETVEWIRIINTSNEKICLNGWRLDDILEKGSKPFKIRGGSIASGGVRTFRKPETRLSLNNSDDCANLINPLGDVVDRICYGKTHKNEVFTHDGGDWQPKPKKLKARSSNRVTTPTSKAVNNTDNQWELKNETLNGKIAFVYDEGEVLYLELDSQKTVPVSYAGSKMDMSMAKQLVNLSQPVTLHVRAFGDARELIGIDQKTQQPIREKQKIPIEFKYLLGLIIMSLGLYGFKRKFFDNSFKKRTISH